MTILTDEVLRKGRSWDPRKHPRVPGGSEKGGQFAPILYFAYGANLGSGVEYRAPDAKPVGRAVLPGHKLTVRGGVMNVEQDRNSQVEGGLLEISPTDLQNLDTYEGKPDIYVREKKKVITEQGEEKQAVVYRMAHQKPIYSHRAHDTTLPSDYYLEEVGQGYRDWGIPTEPLENAVKEAYTRAKAARARTGRPIFQERSETKQRSEARARLTRQARIKFPDADRIDVEFVGMDMHPIVVIWRNWGKELGYMGRAFKPSGKKPKKK